MWVIKEGFEAFTGVILLCQRSCMAELSLGKCFEVHDKDWFNLLARGVRVGIRKCFGRPAKWKWVARAWCGGENKGVRRGGGMDKVEHSEGDFCIGCNWDKVESGETLQDTWEVLYQYCTSGELCCLVVSSTSLNVVFIVSRSPQNCHLSFKSTNGIIQQCGPVGADWFKSNAVKQITS